jgi:hypothetical protein
LAKLLMLYAPRTDGMVTFVNEAADAAVVE